jgi:hypothetical protein
MEAKLQAIRSYLYEHSKQVTHLAVLHTNFHTYNADAHTLCWMEHEARKQCRFFRRCFSQKLYGMKAIRKPSIYAPIMLTTIEGARTTNDSTLTIHYNFGLGNLPEHMTLDELRDVIYECWVLKAGMSGRSMWVEEADKSTSRLTGWIDYITKEAEQGNLECWDFENTQVNSTSGTQT